MKYAKANNLEIQKKPKDFSMFETESDIENENNDKDYSSVYKDTRKLYIVKESYSAKVPRKRKKRKKIVSLVKKWKIKWILSYSPDRQSRNLLEWWELVDLVDQDLVTLKYSNFQFEPNAAGKMMLWVWFTLSKQYSDKLSEDTTRWIKSTLQVWKAMGRFKHGYMKNPDWFFEPHPEYFPIVQEAFKKRIYTSDSDISIKAYMQGQGYKKLHQAEWKPDRLEPFNKRNMREIREDPFYYWILEHWDNVIDQRTYNPYYEPMITEDEYSILYEKLQESKVWKKWDLRKHDFAYSLPESFIKDTDWLNYTHYIKNMYRRKKDLTKLQKTKKKASIKDVVKSKDVVYEMKLKHSKQKWRSLSQEVVESLIADKLKQLKIDKKTFKEVLVHVFDTLERRQEQVKIERRRLNMEMSKLEWSISQLIKAKLLKAKTKKEEKIMEKEIQAKQKTLDRFKSNFDNLHVEGYNLCNEFEAFAWIIGEAYDFYLTSDPVRKRKITKIFFSHIVVHRDNAVELCVHKKLEWLMTRMGRSTGLEPATTGTTNQGSTNWATTAI
mgnify:CR=1 FL=1